MNISIDNINTCVQYINYYQTSYKNKPSYFS